MNEPCRRTLAAIASDPLALPEAAQIHLEGCPACREARVQWLALQDPPPVEPPLGYFETLPGRILRKLPERSSGRLRGPWILWLTAAGLALALGVGGFLAGRTWRMPPTEAGLDAVPAELEELVPGAPFDGEEDPLLQLSELPPEDAETVLRHLNTPPRP